MFNTHAVLYHLLINIYDFYVHCPHIPCSSILRRVLKLNRGRELHCRRSCSLEQLGELSQGPTSVATGLIPSNHKLRQVRVSHLCEDAARIIVWAVHSCSVHKLVIHDQTGMLMSNRLELHYTITAALDKLEKSQQRDLVTRFNFQERIECDLEVVFCDALSPHTEPVDLFISFNGTCLGYPLKYLSDCLMFCPCNHSVLRNRRPQLLEYVNAQIFYESQMRAQADSSFASSQL